MPSMLTAVNIRHTYLNLQVSDFSDRAFLTLDVIKAFDSVEWPYLKSLILALSLVNGSGCYILLLACQLGSMVSSLLLSDSVGVLGRGAHCPPLLVAIAIEPLACLIQTSLDVTGLVRGDMEEKVSLNADDVLLFLTNIRSSLLAVMKYVEEFGRFSGFGISWEKSMLLPMDPLLDSLPPTVSQLRAVSSIKYMGIIIYHIWIPLWIFTKINSIFRYGK